MYVIDGGGWIITKKNCTQMEMEGFNKKIIYICMYKSPYKSIHCEIRWLIMHALASCHAHNNTNTCQYYHLYFLYPCHHCRRCTESAKKLLSNIMILILILVQIWIYIYIWICIYGYVYMDHNNQSNNNNKDKQQRTNNGAATTTVLLSIICLWIYYNSLSSLFKKGFPSIIRTTLER